MNVAACHYVLNFHITKEGKFTIIDWDSDNDMNVINKISHEQVLV